MSDHQHPSDRALNRGAAEPDPAHGSAPGPVLSLAPSLDALDSVAEPLSLRSLADERVVHGLLRAISSLDRGPMDRRVASAVEVLAVDRLGRPQAPDRGVPRAAGSRGPRRRLAAFAARVLPMLALVAVAAIVLRVSMQSSSAIADPLERMVTEHVRAGDKAGPRRYSILIERDTQQGMMPMRGTLDIAPTGGRRPDGSSLRGGRFLVRFGGGDRGPRVAFGFDGEQFWYVPEEGPVRVGPSKAVIEEVNQLRGLVGWLVVERALRQLQPEAGEGRRAGAIDGPLFDLTTDDLDGGRRRHTLRRRDPGPADGWPAFRPSEVIFEAGTSDRVVSTFDAYWPDDESGRSRHPGRIKHLRFELLRDQVPPPEWEWFSHGRHHGSDREVVEVAEVPDRPLERLLDRAAERAGDGPARRPPSERASPDRTR